MHLGFFRGYDAASLHFFLEPSDELFVGFFRLFCEVYHKAERGQPGLAERSLL